MSEMSEMSEEQWLEFLALMDTPLEKWETTLLEKSLREESPFEDQ